MNNILLVGGGEFREECLAMDSYLLESLNKKHPRVAIIPTAAANQRPEQAAENGVRYFDSLGANANPILILNRGHAEDEKYFNDIHEVDLIYLTGGDPKYLLETLYQTHFMTTVTEAVSKGVTLAGSSAGAMVLGSRMRYEKWMQGIGLISNTAVLPHHENSTPETVSSENQSELQSGIELIGIDSATGVFWGDTGVKIAGKGKAIFYSGSTYKIIEPAS
ncbi:MAG: Peptidase E [Chloroflexi bacterium]|jgi:cyanophycinase|nr:MAG: Peptidase E [Chloroflexota bacterium]